MEEISAKIIKDSVGPMGHRLISIQTVAPKFLDAEIEKHRMISSNSSSSRAIPVSRTVKNDPFIPDDIRINEPGMQGYKKLPDEIYEQWVSELRNLHYEISYLAEHWAEKYNIHKQHINRYLEAFTLQTKIMTANIEVWDYFLSLRQAPDADPSIQKLGREILNAIIASEPQELEFGEWHLPYTDSKIITDINTSAAACARTSYSNHDGTPPTAEQDQKLTKFLIENKHMTPFEHQATPHNPWSRKAMNEYRKDGYMYSGNFREWEQYRQEFE